MTDDEAQRVNHLEQSIISAANTFITGSIQFATILVANLMILNGGALLVFPAYINSIKDGSPFRPDMILSATTAFVAGIVLAAAAGYSAYINFNLHAQVRLLEMYIRRVELEEEFDDVSFHRLSKYRAQSKSELRADKDKTNCWIVVTFWAGNTFGIGSIVAFVVGCYFARQAMLP